jgi:hypothetical protein
LEFIDIIDGLVLIFHFATNIPILATGKVKKVPPVLLAVLQYNLEKFDKMINKF